MPRITFTEDVTIDGEVGGPHFRRGYQPDVSDQEARRWIAKGVAVLGAVDLANEQPKDEPKEDEPAFEIPTFHRKRRKF